MIKQKTTTKNNNEKLLTNIKHMGPLSKTIKFGTLHNSDAFWIKFILGTFQAIPSLFQNF